MKEGWGEKFWWALGIQQEWMTRPEVMYDDGELIWKMTAKEGYCFDDAFWEVFEAFPFRICHVSYSGAPWSQEGGPPEMVLRFALLESYRLEGRTPVNHT